MTRRELFKAIIATPLLAPFAVPASSRLMFRKDAFALAMAPIALDDETNIAFEWDASCPAGYNAAHYS